MAGQDALVSEEPDPVHGLALVAAADIERLDVRVAAVVDEARLVAVEHGVDAQREELLAVAFLNLLLLLLLVKGVVHVEQVADPVCVVEGAPHVRLLLSHYFAAVLHYIGSLWNLFQSREAPHSDVAFPESGDLELKMLFVC